MARNLPQPAVNVIFVDGREVRYQVSRTPRRRVSLSVTDDLSVEVLVPRRMRMTRAQVREFVERHRLWLKHQFEERASRKQIFSDGVLLYRGSPFTISIAAVPNISPTVTPNAVTRTFHVFPDSVQPMAVLKKWLAEQTREYVLTQAEQTAKRLDVSFNRVFIRSSQRWGTCSVKRNLGFNWQLICLPEELAEYVVCHEIAHLEQFNHSKQFWQVVGSLCPDYSSRRAALKQFVPIVSLAPVAVGWR